MLNNNVTLYIPTCKVDGIRIPDELLDPWLDKVQTIMVSLFGGCTTQEACGAWQDDLGRIRRERIRIVWSFCDSETFSRQQGEIRSLAKKLKFALVQDCIAVVFNGKMEFVS